MAKLYAIENKLVKIGNSYLGELPVYDVHTYNDGHGSIIAAPSSGNTGTIVTLSNTPNSGYEFDEYVVEGATLSGSTLTIAGSDVSVTGTFKAAAYPLDSVTIGNQVWTSSNLAIDDGQGGVNIVNNVRGSGTQYYYTLAAAQRIANGLPGWHLPTKAEFETLIATVGSSSMSKLASTSGWSNLSGLDTYGFNAKPASYYYSGSVNNAGYDAYWWANTIESGSYQYVLNFSPSWYSEAYMGSMDSRYYSMPIRLVKD